MDIHAAHRRSFVRKLRAILMTDIVGSTPLMRQDEDDIIGRWREFVRMVKSADLPAHRGTMVKSTGDGMLLAFESVADSVRAAIDLLARIERMNIGLPQRRHITLRIGIHLADIVIDDIDIFGDGVNLAARLASVGGPQEIIVSTAVRDQLTDGLDVTLEDLGERELKGYESPVRIYRAQPVRAERRLLHPSGTRSARPSIAVIPFQQTPSDPAHALIGDVIADDLIRTLSHRTSLIVISRLSTAAFRDRTGETNSLAQALQVRYVLSGTVQVEGVKVRVSAKLTDAERDEIIWSDRFEGDIGRLFELQDAMSTQMAIRVLRLVERMELQRARAKGLESLTAYEYILLGIDQLHRSTPDDMEVARSLFRAAVASDPGYPGAYAWLARWHVLQVGQGWSKDIAFDTKEANRLVSVALDRDPTDSWALSVQGLVESYLNKDLEAAIERLDHAIALNASAPSAWVWSTSAHAWLGRGAEAVERSRRAIELSPFDPHMHYFTSIAGTAHAVQGEYDEAIEYCKRSLRLNKTFTSTHRILAISLALSGRSNEARAAGAALLALEPGLTVESFKRRYPGSASEHVELFCEGLRRAGIPS